MMNRRTSLALFLAALAAAAGCQRSTGLPGPSGTVTGKATYKDRPVPDGSIVVMVHKDSGIIATGGTDASGNFTMLMRDAPDILVGDYTVNLNPPGKPDENINVLTIKNCPEAWKLVPKAYWFQTTSPETYTVKEGANAYEFVLHD
jgi:hypothetical protein